MAPVRGTQKPAMSIISEVGELEPKVTYSLLKTSNQVYLPIFSQFGEIVWQRLFNIARILQTTALKLSHCMGPNCCAFNEVETRHEILKYKSSIITDTGNRDLGT